MDVIKVISIEPPRRARRFLAPVPLFGTKNNRAPLSSQEQSPYYWWWAYLKRNKKYVRCCDRGGKGPLASLYADFGDVRGSDFKKWWDENERGRRLFAEPSTAHQLTELASKDEWHDDWSPQTTMVVAIPLTWSKRSIQKRMNALLKKRHTRKRGKMALNGRETSDALYPLAHNYNVHSLKVSLAVFDAVEAAKASKEKVTYYDLGVAMKLVRTAMPTIHDLKISRRDADKVNVMTVAVSRHYKRAAQTVENVAKGIFP